MEYVNVLRVSPFRFTPIGLPAVSNTSTRPTSVDVVLLTRAICVAQPPAIANCGLMTAFDPPTVPAFGVLGVTPAVNVCEGTPPTGAVTATGSVLNMMPEKRRPTTANGVEL